MNWCHVIRAQGGCITYEHDDDDDTFTISAGLQHYASATTEEDFYTLALTSLQTQLQQSNRLSLP